MKDRIRALLLLFIAMSFPVGLLGGETKTEMLNLDIGKTLHLADYNGPHLDLIVTGEDMGNVDIITYDYEKMIRKSVPVDAVATYFKILQINPFVSFVVLFQCKRYQGSVTPSQIGDFRGAMMGRADKGIILTAGTFTTDAKREARRDGASPIELVAGEDLIKLFENLELGLMPRKTFEIDHKFFDEFSKKI